MLRVPAATVVAAAIAAARLVGRCDMIDLDVLDRRMTAEFSGQSRRDGSRDGLGPENLAVGNDAQFPEDCLGHSVLEGDDDPDGCRVVALRGERQGQHESHERSVNFLHGGCWK